MRKGERVDRTTLTANEKILLHLREVPSPRDASSLPVDLTQEGIAAAVGMRTTHVSRALKALKAEELVAETLSRVDGSLRRRRVYFLTEEGILAASRMREELLVRSVLVADGGRAQATRLADLRSRLPKGVRTVHVFQAIDERGVVNLARLEVPKPGRFLVVGPLSRPEPFYGREESLQTLDRWFTSPTPALLLWARRGMGKSALAASFALSAAERSNVFWHALHHADPYEGLVDALGAWMDAVRASKPAAAGIRPEAFTARVGALCAQARWLFVLDDLAPGHARLDDFLPLLIRSVAAASSKVLVTSDARWMPRREELVADRVLREVELQGLDPDSCRRILGREVPAAEFDKVYRLAEGHPLSFKLLAADDTAERFGPQRFTPEEMALLRYLRVMEESER